MEDVPAVTAGESMSHAADGPESAHCAVPAGRLRVDLDVPTARVAQPASGPQMAWAGDAISSTAGPAARATAPKWLETTTKASARCAFGRDWMLERS
ncbi:MAG: hypothetical protein E6I36_03045 [Chloroflexi bacterium]|nr:MAG: hypothetical protein E6I36_03045 [Chloroflexota bacterium]